MEGQFLHHSPCELCGSSDAKAIYSNGTAYCFSCLTWYGSEGGQMPTTANLISDLEPIGKTLRGLRAETLQKYSYQYGSHKEERGHIAPYFNLKGELCAQHVRLRGKQFRWVGQSHELQLFGQHLWKPGKRLVITEGEIDAMTVAQVFNLKWPVVSIPSGASSAQKYIKQNLEWLESFEEVVFAFDNDEPGQKAVEECAVLLTPGKVKVVNWHPYKDANEMLEAGKASEIAPKIFQAKEYRPDGIVAGTDLSLEYLQAEEDVQGFELPYPKLNEKLKTLRKGELTTLTAGTGAGKSTLAREIAYHLVKAHDLKLGHIALEESVKKSALGFMALDLDVPMGDLFLNKAIVSQEDFQRAYQEMIASNKIFFYDHFGSLESDNLLAKIKYLAAGLQVDFIVLDHISIVVSGIADGDERRTIDNLMTSLRSIVENTGVGMILITHLRVPQGQKKAHEEGGRVTLNQLRGSGSIKQLSDNIIAVERDQQAEDPNVADIRLLKNRLFGITGLTDRVRYDIFSGRLRPVEDEVEEFETKNSEEEFNYEPF